jgi:hypothetical protein
MRKPREVLILLLLFIVLTLVSIATAYAVHQNDLFKEITHTLCTYTSTAEYNYTATLDPNVVYNNRTTLKPNEGTLYTKIVKQIELTLKYNFYSTLPAETSIAHSLTETLRTEDWEYELDARAETETHQTRIQITISPVDRSSLQAIKSAIESETGTSVSTYSLQITPTFTIEANTTAGPIHQVFTPTLTISFQRDVITIEDLHQTKSGEIIESEIVAHHEVIGQRITSYIFVAVSIIGLSLSTYFYVKAKPETRKIPLDKLLAPHKGLTIEAREPLELPSEAIVIIVETIVELVRAAEILAKPIILTKKPEPSLVIIDQNTIYQYRP